MECTWEHASRISQDSENSDKVVFNLQPFPTEKFIIATRIHKKMEDKKKKKEF